TRFGISPRRGHRDCTAVLLALRLVHAAFDRVELDLRDLRRRGPCEGGRVALEVDHAVLDDRRELLVLLRRRGLCGGAVLVEREREADACRGLAVERRLARLDEEVLVLVQAVADRDPVDAASSGRSVALGAAAAATAAGE